MLGPVTVYDGDQRRAVCTLLELDGLLDALAAVGPPGWVEITSGADNGVLSIALGHRDLSSLRLVDSDSPAVALASTGTLHAVLGSYDFAGPRGCQPVAAEEAIAIGEARAAVREFVQTGRRPTGVGWRPTHAPGFRGDGAG